MCFFSPPILRMSCSPEHAWMTEPDPKNRHALKNAWVKTWKIAAANAPAPAPKNMYPSWETVEYASTFLMSFCASPMVAAKIAVSPPTTATTRSAVGACRKIGLQRATM